MKPTKMLYFVAIGLALSFVATGCKKKPVGVTQLPDYAKTGAPGEGLPPARPIEGEQTGGTTPLSEDLSGNLEEKFNLDRTALEADTVHFAYDSSAIRSNEKGHIQAVADYLKANPGVALLIEGHCDERGTEEYNRALGERRALALREALIALGADGSKITTRSYGKDRRIALGNDEASHAKNRRGEFVVLRPK
jgi:peptidoglycan-associated lipoprotein